MSAEQRAFVAAVFRMETGLNAVTISKIGFNEFFVEADDGNTYLMRN